MSLKILFLSHKFYPDIGGIETNSEILGSAFHDFGTEVHLLTWTRDHSKKKFSFIVKRNPGIRQLWKEHLWADIVFENNPCLRLSWPNLFIHKPLVIALNTWVSRSNGKKKTRDKLKLLWFKRARKIIAVSEALRKKEWTKAVVIENSYNCDIFKLNTNIEKSINFVFLGRLVSDKGADQAILAIFQLLKNNRLINFPSKPSLTIIGDGPEKIKLEQLVSDLKLENYIHFTGTLTGETLVASLNRHKYLLVPSVWEEPFGNVALEGMACGCLPIVSDGGGLPDAVGNAGLKFKRGDVEDMVECIIKLLDNPILEQQLRLAAKTHLTAHLPDIICKKYLRVIQEAFM